MNKEKIKNRRIIAIIIVVALLILSAGSDLVNMKMNKLKSDENFIKSQLTSLTDRGLKEKVISGKNQAERILVLRIEGSIQGSSYMPSGAGYNHVETLRALEAAKDDKSIKGIILRVDSPGGTVYHSAELWKKIMDLKEASDIKIYTSMGTVAASGGYYIAAPSDKIFASEETTTGSIGVIADYVNYSGLEEKLGIKHNVIKSARHKDIGSPSRDMTDEEREILSNSVMASYEKFLDVVSQGRNIPKDKLRPIADGRIYDGRQALNNGLIDEIGYFEDVVLAMTEDLGLTNPLVYERTNPSNDYLSNFFGLPLGRMLGERSDLDLLYDIRNIYGENNNHRILYMYGGF